MKKVTRSLRLNKETVRQLTSKELGGVGGGNMPSYTACTACNHCSTYVDTGCYATSAQCTPTQDGCLKTNVC